MKKTLSTLVLLASLVVIPVMPALAAVATASWCAPPEPMECSSMASNDAGTVMPCCADTSSEPAPVDLGNRPCCALSNDAAREQPLDRRSTPTAHFALARSANFTTEAVIFGIRTVPPKQPRAVRSTPLFALNDAWLI